MSTNTILEKYQKTFSKNREFAQQADHIFPDGVPHDNRHTEPFPIYIKSTQGSKKWSIDEIELIDYWSGHGALLLGHSPPEIVEAVTQQMPLGTHYGACHALEVEWGSLEGIDPLSGTDTIRQFRHGSDLNGNSVSTDVYRKKQIPKICRTFSRMARLRYFRCESAV